MTTREGLALAYCQRRIQQATDLIETVKALAYNDTRGDGPRQSALAQIVVLTEVQAILTRDLP